MKIEISKKQQTMILSCLNERAALYQKSLKESIDPIQNKLVIKGYKERLKTINSIKELISPKKGKQTR